MTDIDRRRRRRRLLLVLAFIATVGGVVLLTALDQLGKDRAALVAAFLSVVAIAAAWEATGRASDTAEEARKTAQVVARIERDRWLAELTPQFEFTLTKEGDHAAKLLVHLAGPDALGRLDSVRSGSVMTTTTTPPPNNAWASSAPTAPRRSRSRHTSGARSASGPAWTRPTTTDEN
ncbi:hypothetical protein [Streptomyces lavendulocolor]|uniref:hypothetical protein n=1 Tax=Streptomyces lavendulocolor TaxID=67316 RepID=UPI0033CFF16B